MEWISYIVIKKFIHRQWDEIQGTKATSIN